MRKAVYPGTFDPITVGHLDIIERASQFVDELHILVADNINKSTIFTAKERVEYIKRVTSKIPNLVITSSNDLVVRYAKTNNIKLLVRGLRNIKDYEYEYSLFQYNINIYEDVETILMFPRSTTNFISSSSIKELVHYNVNIDKYVPKEIIVEVTKKIKEKGK